MIPSYIDNWLTIIEQMNNDNTYKLAWGRALIECLSFDKCYQDKMKIVVKFEDIAECMLKYYWNQLFFFKLKQSPYTDKEPVICKNTKYLIDEYKNKNNNTQIPIWFDDAKSFFLKKDKDKYYNTIKDISKVLHFDVCYRFMNITKGKLDIYEYDKKNSLIKFNYEDAILLKDYGIVVSKLLNYKWSQLLEKFNYAPKIVSKVNGISDSKIKRNNLNKYKEELLKEFNGNNPIDFYTGKELNKDDISVDHVIPWSFMYSDDIWNLVLTSKSYNSSKSNNIPSKEIIDKLKERNNKLINILDGKYKSDIEISINDKLVDKFYYECRL